MSHNHSHWSKQADAMSRALDGLHATDELESYDASRLGEDLIVDFKPQDRKPTAEEVERDAFLRQLAPSDPAHRMCFMVKPGFPIYTGDTITRGKTTLKVEDGVPVDATLVMVFNDPLNYGLCLQAIFEHPSFPAIPEGAVCPNKAITYTIDRDVR